jgi:hypothetical protein
VHVRVVVPSVNRSHRPLPSQRFRKRIEETLLEVTTGTTTYEGVGAWKNGGARAVRERILIVESYMPARLSTEARRRVANCLAAVACDANQDALFVAIDGRPFLLQGTPRQQRKEI